MIEDIVGDLFNWIYGNAALVVSLVISTGMLYLVYRQYGHTRRVESARLLVDYVERILDKHQPLFDIMRDRENGGLTKLNERDVKVLFNELESIIKFVDDGVLDKDQVLSTLRTTLMRIKKDKEFMLIVTKIKNESPNKDLYKSIFNFLDKEV